MSDENWRWRARCAEVDPELFYPIGTTGPALLQVEEAKAVCRQCPVRLPCLAEGWEQQYGIWGGLSEDERKQLRRAKSPV